MWGAGRPGSRPPGPTGALYIPWPRAILSGRVSGRWLVSLRPTGDREPTRHLYGRDDRPEPLGLPESLGPTEVSLPSDRPSRPGHSRRGLAQPGSDVSGVSGCASRPPPTPGAARVLRSAARCADASSARSGTRRRRPGSRRGAERRSRSGGVPRVLDGLDHSRQRLADVLGRELGSAPCHGACDRVRQRVHRVREQLAAALGPSADVVRTPVEAPKVGPRTARNGLIAFCLGLVLALIVVFLADALDTRVRSVDTIREVLGLRLLGRLAPPPSRLRQRRRPGHARRPDEPRRRAVPRPPLESRPRERRPGCPNDHDHERRRRGGKVDDRRQSRGRPRPGRAPGRPRRRRSRPPAPPPALRSRPAAGADGRRARGDVARGRAATDQPDRGLVRSRRLEQEDGHTGSLEVLPAGFVLQDPDELGFDRAVGRIVQR